MFEPPLKPQKRVLYASVNGARLGQNLSGHGQGVKAILALAHEASRIADRIAFRHESVDLICNIAVFDGHSLPPREDAAAN
jgi:hypothetical protein